MIRAVLAFDPNSGWRLFRQQQWMAEIRRNLNASTWEKHFFDIMEPEFLGLLAESAQWLNETWPEIKSRLVKDGSNFHTSGHHG
jgi:1,6-anhydro-N-acetylmuramate kinase